MPAPEYFESLMLIFFSLNWYWSIARMLNSRASEGKSISANMLIALGYIAAILANLGKAEVDGALPILFWICCWNMVLTLVDLALILRFRKRPGRADLHVVGTMTEDAA